MTNSSFGSVKKDIFQSSILGEWTLDHEKTNKKTIWHTRSAVVKLNEDFAQDYYDEETKSMKKIFGEVKLTEKKSMDRNTSNISMHRSVERTPGSLFKMA